MKTSLLTIKLYIPPTRPNLVLRPRLFERLQESLSCKLVLISAPAGFGKLREAEILLNQGATIGEASRKIEQTY